MSALRFFWEMRLYHFHLIFGVIEACWHPSGVRSPSNVYRGYRSAQPPAIRCHPSGMKIPVINRFWYYLKFFRSFRSSPRRWVELGVVRRGNLPLMRT
jgi:hypothetical protein